MSSKQNNTQQFSDYLKDNYNKIKSAFNKSNLWDEDVYHNTIIKVYDQIDKGLEVNSIKDYFFIYVKFELMKRTSTGETKYTARKFNELPDNFNIMDEDENREEYYKKIDRLFEIISEEVNNNFDDGDADIYLIYKRLKSNNKGFTTKYMAELLNENHNKIRLIISKINKFVTSNQRIQYEYNKLNS